jgi:hypothetical protein
VRAEAAQWCDVGHSFNATLQAMQERIVLFVLFWGLHASFTKSHWLADSNAARAFIFLLLPLTDVRLWKCNNDGKPANL